MALHNISCNVNIFEEKSSRTILYILVERF